MAPLLSVQALDVAFQLPEGEFLALENISFHIYPNEVVGIVGESGCGKSLTSQAIMGILPGVASIKHGNISFQGCSLNDLSSREWQELRGNELTMIFQEPMTSLNPVLTIGRQIAEVLKKHTSLSKIERKQQVIKTMNEVGLPRAEALWKAYPHQLSGGMRQRVSIAMALISRPKLMIADEPTTALDVTIQSQILDLFQTIKQNHSTSLLFISHDLGVIQAVCDQVIVMYAGRIVEQGKVEKLISEPKHPYTQSLIQSIPDATKRGQRLYTIPGTVPHLQERQVGCPFSNRCTYKLKQCETSFPDTYEFDDGHTVACHLFAKEGDGN
ncbi:MULTISPECIES: ABC transporter ATP-binding protein [Clostridia]|uniref:ABC transporter ATP-binding protein n=1 Tax=Clostridia TaxID=186801 RepID=UPI000EA27743|nr:MULTISPECIES: ABC transporter ATP-binding protein [Clostridia]NBJ68230.1 ABC transporter ATP-binding protein [Roseburia sp. 1XD42-34]RKI81997.1 ABC transporter ATP-binding protein [Clostridium sp. 1xD42-85]